MTWLVTQTEEEIMAESQQKALKATRVREFHAFKDELDKEVKANGSISQDQKYKLFNPYFKRCGFTAKDAWDCLRAQMMQKAMNMRTSDEKKHKSRDIYTDRDGFVDNIRTSENPMFLKNIGETQKKRAEKSMKIYHTCQETMQNIGKEQSKQVELITENGTED